MVSHVLILQLSYDQLVELKADLDSLHHQTNDQQSPLTSTTEPNGLEMLLAASDSVGHQPAQTHGVVHSPSDGTFGVGDAMGALDGPFLLDFLQQPYESWNANSFDPSSGMPAAQFQFDWENANLFGNPGNV